MQNLPDENYKAFLKDTAEAQIKGKTINLDSAQPKRLICLFLE